VSNSEYIFNYLDDVWGLLPEADRLRFAETWKAYEQTYGDVYMQMFERKMAVNIDYLPLYNIRRWQSFVFDDTTAINQAAVYRSGQDLSLGINLENRYLIALRVDDGPARELDLRGVDASKTKLSEIVQRINSIFGDTIAFAVQSNQLLELRSPTTGDASSIEFLPTSDSSKDASEIILGFDPVQDLPRAFPRFPYDFALADKTITAIPQLQDAVTPENISVNLQAGVDYDIEFNSGVISFAKEPPALMWAPDTFVNNETPYNNYGCLLDIYDNNTASYLKAVKGLWYAFWTGPRPENIKRSLYLLFGLPTASANGAVTGLNETSITLTYDDQSTETFAIPDDLTSIVGFGQRVTRFEPLVSGIRVFDKVNYPGFVNKEVGRYGVQPFLTEKASRGNSPETDETKALRLLEANAYLPQIDVATFISPDIKLSNVRTFLSTLQPRSRSYLFQVLVGVFREKLTLLDDGPTGNTRPGYPNGQPAMGLHTSFNVTPNVDYNPNTEVSQDQLNQAELDDYTYLRLDEGWSTGDRVAVEVRSEGSLIDMFVLEG
jgi:hypothetical protein